MEGNELLSICIPTFNRANCLKALLAGLARELRQHNIGPEQVKIYILDNCSPDRTLSVVESFGDLPHLSCQRNTSNIGADRNIVRAYSIARGKYTWVIGDDDGIVPGALPVLLSALDLYEPGLVINTCRMDAYGFRVPVRFQDYKMFMEMALSTNPFGLIAHSLITANVVRNDCFDRAIAE